GALFLSQLQPNLTIPILPNGSVCVGRSLPFNLTIADGYNLTDATNGPLYVYIEVRGTDLAAPPVKRGWMQLERRKGSSGGSKGGSSGGSKGGSTSGGSTSGGTTSGGTSGAKPGGSTG
ncbi:hypothetical protein HDU99_010022, partial [Rhizoclosmatium hyalinum]